MNKKISLKIAVVVVLIFAGLFAGISESQANVAEATVIFLLIAPGARAGGMGEAFVAITDDATATWWNPAGLAFLKNREFTFMHVKWLPGFRLEGLYYDFVSYINNVEDWGTFGMNVIFLNLGETEGRNELNQFTGMFRTFETAISGSYGATVTDNLAIGLNTKFIYSHLSDRGAGQEQGTGTSSNFALDLGILYKTRVPFAGTRVNFGIPFTSARINFGMPIFGNRINFGANLANLGPKMAYIDAAQADPIPTNLKFGLALHMVDMPDNRLTFVFEMNKLLVRKDLDDGVTDPFYIALVTAWTDEPVFTDMIYNMGFEYWYSDLVALRTGYYHDEMGDVKPFTYGASFKVSSYRFDFSYVAAGKGHPLTDTMRLSLTVDF